MGKAEFSKLDNEESVDLKFAKLTQRRSHASLLHRHKSDEDTIDIIVRLEEWALNGRRAMSRVFVHFCVGWKEFPSFKEYCD